MDVLKNINGHWLAHLYDNQNRLRACHTVNSWYCLTYRRVASVNETRRTIHFSKKNEAMKNIFLVRHGQASAGTDNYDRLSTLGIRQAVLLGEFWRRNGFRIDEAFSGSLERQQDTASLAMADLAICPEIKTIDALNEYDHTIIDRLFSEGITSDTALNLQFEQYLSIMQRWRDAERVPAEAESWQTFAQRGWQSVESEAASTDASSLVFFTSGGIIATILKQLLDLNFKQTMHAIWQTRNTSVTHLRIDETDTSENNACLVDYNTIAHLQLHHDKTLITQI